MAQHPSVDNSRQHAAAVPPDVLMLLPHIKESAVAMAREAGVMAAQAFAGSVQVEFKDKDQRDPVTSADKEIQAYLVQAISSAFPDHGVLGEEGQDEEEGDTPAPDFLWVLDPLDGTTNFLNGFPVYAVSIGVLYRGVPVVGCLYIPWPQDGSGMVLHAHKAGGAHANGTELTLSDAEGPVANRLSGIPGSFGGQYRAAKPLRSKVGEVRVSGSIAYELAMVAKGVLQYAIIGAPRMWDMAAGAIIVSEAGGVVLMRHRRQWEPMDSLVPTWDSRPPTMKELRRWVGPLIAGNPGAAPFVAAHLRRRRPSLQVRLLRLLRRWGQRKTSSKGDGSRGQSRKAPS